MQERRPRSADPIPCHPERREGPAFAVRLRSKARKQVRRLRLGMTSVAGLGSPDKVREPAWAVRNLTAPVVGHGNLYGRWRSGKDIPSEVTAMPDDPSAAASPATSRPRRLLAEWLPLVAMLALLLAARDTLANHYQVPSGSMQPTLVPGDRVAVDMRAYGVRLPFTSIELAEGTSPAPGDVVVFDSPVDGTRLIKRLVAVEGQTVAVREGRLWVDGRPTELDGQATTAAQVFERIGPRQVQLDLADGGGPDLPPQRIPAGMALVLGDHRGASFDGRGFGLVPLDTFYGRAIAVYYRSGEGFVWNRL